MKALIGGQSLDVNFIDTCLALVGEIRSLLARWAGADHGK